jgi:hypothetical protein
MLCNHMTQLEGLISAAGFCSQFMMVKQTFIWLFFSDDVWFHLHDHVSSWNNQYWSLILDVPLHDVISTYFNGIDSVCLYRGSIFSTSFYAGKLILLFLLSDTWIVSGKSYSAWWWVMQFLLGNGKWQLHLTFVSRCTVLLHPYFPILPYCNSL